MKIFPITVRITSLCMIDLKYYEGLLKNRGGQPFRELKIFRSDLVKGLKSMNLLATNNDPAKPREKIFNRRNGCPPRFFNKLSNIGAGHKHNSLYSSWIY